MDPLGDPLVDSRRDRWRTLRAHLPMALALAGVAAVWLGGAWWLFELKQPLRIAAAQRDPFLILLALYAFIPGLTIAVLLSHIRDRATRRCETSASPSNLDELGRRPVSRAIGRSLGRIAIFLASLGIASLILLGVSAADAISASYLIIGALGFVLCAAFVIIYAARFGWLWSASVTRVVERETVREVVRTEREVRPVPVTRVVEKEARERTVIRETERIVRVPTPMEPEREETDVYRLYDADDVLLYVGIAGSAAQRWRTHAGTKPWWPEVARHHTVRYPFRGQALAVEHSAIRHERPKYNRNGGGLNDSQWPHGWDQPRHVAAVLPPSRVSSGPDEGTVTESEIL